MKCPDRTKAKCKKIVFVCRPGICIRIRTCCEPAFQNWYHNIINNNNKKIIIIVIPLFFGLSIIQRYLTFHVIFIIKGVPERLNIDRNYVICWYEFYSMCVCVCVYLYIRFIRKKAVANIHRFFKRHT